MIRIPTNRTPTHPGEMLLEEFLVPMELTQREAGRFNPCFLSACQRPGQWTAWDHPNTALRLAKYFGNTAAFWMNLQLRWDLYFADQAEQQVLKRIHHTKFIWQGINLYTTDSDLPLNFLLSIYVTPPWGTYLYGNNVLIIEWD